MLEPSDYSAEFAEHLRSLGVEAALIGALAALRYRHRPRYTTDVDFLARTLDGIAASVEADGFETKELAEPDEEPYVIFIRATDAESMSCGPRPRSSTPPLTGRLGASSPSRT